MNAGFGLTPPRRARPWAAGPPHGGGDVAERRGPRRRAVVLWAGLPYQ